MSVEPGFGGQSVHPRGCWTRCAPPAGWWTPATSRVLVEIDGGINDETIEKAAAEAGGDGFGGAFRSVDPR